ncbi:MAG: hypothetical protein A2655_02645 [Candidatus Yanofskybacteria bacterium RIFCSPHIGHO2_01_FULL_43_42]|uniref:Uncharacterized protein n=1 Tax=Candidatus Yanofskybacteria bacterium RIFCSPLOWO2_01_FULL_43_22 TaxID=1802695 RepID=A0A1F8GHN1_9BACT|nr:MAG: hypothetical protein A2655_02645 [Candidatus Yanofskybacteria bacterium RIFCSPHIGHO2_01_FULL_43_42]OGN12448.1 MAG: hypothetical protein A3D48_00565 [Candidatus Yanofskybacteria bacterium RIFCSPHIGHO2_02_FULL_43_17]OGN24907.1 MAG: hypothetical protein A3A13_03080 [Candidatus Yanofskybacteria bacterium RIFCSPLOWO2_01_FULL_43_22]
MTNAAETMGRTGNEGGVEEEIKRAREILRAKREILQRPEIKELRELIKEYRFFLGGDNLSLGRSLQDESATLVKLEDLLHTKIQEAEQGL